MNNDFDFKRVADILAATPRPIHNKLIKVYIDDEGKMQFPEGRCCEEFNQIIESEPPVRRRFTYDGQGSRYLTGEEYNNPHPKSRLPSLIVPSPGDP